MRRNNEKVNLMSASASFDLTEAETKTLESVLTDSNRTLNNFVETLLKKTISKIDRNTLMLDLTDLGIRYRIEKNKPKPSKKS